MKRKSFTGECLTKTTLTSGRLKVWRLLSTHEAKQKKLAEQIQLLAYDEVPHVSWGQFIAPSAFRKNVKGVLEFGATILWNIQV